MTTGEFAFLAMGLVLGLCAGAALIVVIRSRPPSKREVRLTVATDAIPRRRSATLAGEAFLDPTASAEPARGGPADRRHDAVATGQTPIDRRTPVREPRPGTIEQPAFRLAEPRSSDPQAVPVTGGRDPMLTALRASAAASAAAAMRSPTRTALLDEPRPQAATAADPSGRASAAKTRDAAPAKGGGTGTSVEATPTGDAGSAVDTTGPCVGPRRIADERCELAGRARAHATAAEGKHRAAQRAYDEHETSATNAANQADARAVRRAKDDAQARFRNGRTHAKTTEEVEAAARAWLLEINAINNEAREGTAILARERLAAQTLAADLERTALDSDAARIAAETAEAACVVARESVADCEERQAGGLAGHFPVMPSQGEDDDEDEGDPLDGALRAGGSPRIFRLLRGERAAMHEMIVALGGQDADGRHRWQVALSDLVDAIVADSLAATALEFPAEHPFWGPFDRSQAREITSALSSLGYRFDGFGGWIDDRIPSQRDLSLALGYAGLDPMRVRQWPNESEMADLFADVQVTAAEHLAMSAGDLTLGELVTMLGRRADNLAEVWNAWGRIRPLLLEDT